MGWHLDLAAHPKRGGRVIGICGRYKMLGKQIGDPVGVEGPAREVNGVGLLDVRTAMTPGRVLRNSSAVSTRFNATLLGDQIHLGVTDGPDCANPITIIDSSPDGAVSADGKVAGTYLRSLFGSKAYRKRLLESCGVAGDRQNYRQSVE